MMVGVDSSPTALAQARRKLDAAGVPALLLEGDVSDPDRLSASLAEHGLEMQDGLHIRAFLDHDRGYLGADADVPRTRLVERRLRRRPRSPAGRRGRRARPGRSSAPLDSACRQARDGAAGGPLRRAGNRPQAPRRAAQRRLRRPSGLLGQYPIDHAAFLRCCREAGLEAEGRFERRYPSSRPFVTVSLNRFLAPGVGDPLPATEQRRAREDTWQPAPGADLEDGRALHEMLFAGGDIRYPQSWCSAPTGFVVAGALAAIEARLRSAGEGDVIRVLDYGAGTGTATIELLKACRASGVEQQLDRLGASLEIHLVDMPSSWFAQGYRLLGGCAWTRFHSLRDEAGSFRPLPQVTGGRAMDVVMANMVFHLIPPRALERAVEELAEISAADGRLLWSARTSDHPVGIRFRCTIRTGHCVSAGWSCSTAATAAGRPGGPAPTGPLGGGSATAVRDVRADLDGQALRHAQDRADRRILPRPLAADVIATLEGRFEGEVESRGYEMLAEEIVRGLLVPSNQAEYLPEISDRAVRERVIRELMTEEIVPAMQEGKPGPPSASTCTGRWARTRGGRDRGSPPRGRLPLQPVFALLTEAVEQHDHDGSGHLPPALEVEERVVVQVAALSLLGAGHRVGQVHRLAVGLDHQHVRPVVLVIL